MLSFGKPIKAGGDDPKFLLQLPVEINLLERNDDLFLAGERADGILTGTLGIAADDLCGLELFDHTGHFGTGELIEHPAEAPQCVDIVAFQSVAIVFSNHRVELDRHALKTNGDIVLLHLLSKETRIGFLGGRGRHQKWRGEQCNEGDKV